MTDVTVLVAFTAGLFSFLSPCVLPLVPSYLSFLTGMSLEALQEETRPRGRVLLHALAFVGGFSVVFVALGMSISAAGQMLLAYRAAIRLAGGLLVLVLGLHLLGRLAVAVASALKAGTSEDEAGGCAGIYGGGHDVRHRLDAVCWTYPRAILTLAGSAETVQTGTSMLVAYSLGLAAPFVLAAVSLGKFLAVLAKYRYLIPLFERSAGVPLIAVGVLMLTDQWSRLNAYAISLTPMWLLERL